MLKPHYEASATSSNSGSGAWRNTERFYALVYAACGHEQWFMRGPMNYRRDALETELRQFYAACVVCTTATAAEDRASVVLRFN